MIDDIHLQSNIKANLLEFIRTWCVSKGYYDFQKGMFKSIGEFGTIMAKNSEYKSPNGDFNSRFPFYASTLYADEYEFDRYKIFI